MSCELAQTRLHAYLDGELDAAGSADFGEHLKACPTCAAALSEEQKLREALQQSRLYVRAPAGLKLRIEESLPGPQAHQKAGVVWWRWFAVLAAALFAATLAWRQLGPLGPTSYGQTSVVAAVDAHLRSLEPGHLVDVESTDQHTVKPWFDGKLDFAPPVHDFSANGFPLLGGRLDVVAGRTVAALVYGRRKHFISLFVEKSRPEPQGNGAGETQGYHWNAWDQGGFHFCAVSDVSSADLDELKQLLQQN